MLSRRYPPVALLRVVVEEKELEGRCIDALQIAAARRTHCGINETHMFDFVFHREGVGWLVTAHRHMWAEVAAKPMLPVAVSPDAVPVPVAAVPSSAKAKAVDVIKGRDRVLVIMRGLPGSGKVMSCAVCCNTAVPRPVRR